MSSSNRQMKVHGLAEQLALDVKAALKSQPGPSGVIQGVRKIRKGLPGRCAQLFPSVINGNVLMPCETNPEADNCLHLEYAHNRIKRYRTQPVELLIQGQRYYPDVVIEYFDGHIEFQEIKPEGMLESESVSTRLKAIESFIVGHGYLFTVRTAEVIQEQPMLGNLEYLFRGAGEIETPDVHEVSKAFITQQGGKTDIRSLRGYVVSCGLRPLTVERLIWSGELAFDVNRRLSSSSVIWNRGLS